MRCIVHANSRARADELAERLEAEGHTVEVLEALEARSSGTDEVAEASAPAIAFVDSAIGADQIDAFCKYIDARSSSMAARSAHATLVVTFGATLSSDDAERLIRAGVDDDVGPLDEGFGARLRFAQRRSGARDAATGKLTIEQLATDRLRLLSAVAANLGHEVNNSLVYIMANVRMAKDRLKRHPPRKDDDSIELLEEALEGTDCIAQIVADLGRFRVTEAVSDTNVHDVLDACLRMIRSPLRSRVQIVRNFHAVPYVRANEARLLQSLLSVLINVEHAIPPRPAASIGAAPPRMTLPTLTVTTRASADRVFVDVHDDGDGIVKEHLDRIFEPFFTTKKSDGHLGLGLSICKSLLTCQGGDVTVTSGPGIGTTVTLELPAGPATTASADDVKKREDGRRRILVIDDEPFVARSIRDSLARYDIDIASGGREAIALIDESPYDAIVCDVMMPEMSGQDLYEELSSRRRGEEARVVFITGGAYTADAASFVARIKNPCVEKPFDMATLIAAIEDVARVHATRT